MTDRGPYQTHQHAVAERVTAMQLAGQHVGLRTAESVFGGPAILSTAPYVPPGTRRSERQGKCKGKADTCRAAAIKGTDLCVFHSPGQARPDREEVPGSVSLDEMDEVDGDAAESA